MAARGLRKRVRVVREMVIIFYIIFWKIICILKTFKFNCHISFLLHLAFDWRNAAFTPAIADLTFF